VILNPEPPGASVRLPAHSPVELVVAGLKLENAAVEVIEGREICRVKPDGSW
jgi:hypothetical protein